MARELLGSDDGRPGGHDGRHEVVPKTVRGHTLEPGNLAELVDVVLDGAHGHAPVRTRDEERRLGRHGEPAQLLEGEQPGHCFPGPSVERNGP